MRLSSSSSSSSSSEGEFSSEEEEGDEKDIVPVATNDANVSDSIDDKNPKIAATAITSSISTDTGKSTSHTNTGIVNNNSLVAGESDGREDDSSADESNDDDDDDDDGIEWEDAVSFDEEDENDVTTTITTTTTVATRKRALPTQDITIDFGDGDDDDDHNDETKEPEKKKRRKTRNVYKLQNLPSDVQSLLLSIRRSHMLSLTSRAVLVSSTCSDWELLHVGHSFIPFSIMDRHYQFDAETAERRRRRKMKAKTTPEENEVNEFCTWYFDMVNNVSERRRRRREENIAAGAPQVRNSRSSTRRSGRGTTRRKGRRRKANSSSSSIPRSGKQGKYREEGIGVTNPSRLIEILHLLSPTHDENPQYYNEDLSSPTNLQISRITSHEKAQLLIAVARSLGWRARYVVALEPVGRDLTIDHPLLAMNVKDVFRSIYKATKDGKKMGSRVDKAGEKNSHPETSNVDVIDLIDDSDDNSNEKNDSKSDRKVPNGSTSKTNETNVFTKSELGWVEILCCPNAQTKLSSSRQRKGSKSSTSSKKTSSSPRWIHVDPQRESFDKPQTMESVLFSLQSSNADDENNKKGKKRIKKGMATMSYVLAVEHPMSINHGGEEEESDLASLPTQPYGNNNADLRASIASSRARLRAARITDVTPRYANAWSKTLRLRGATGVQIASSRGKCVDLWWAETIRKSNRLFRRLARTNVSNKEKKLQEVDEKEVQQKENGSKVMQTQGEKNKADNHGQSSDEDHASDLEKDELHSSTKQEAIPTSKAAFKKHPLYVIPSVMLSNEVLAPDARKRICGVFKGQLVYKRSDVSTALAAKKWLYQGRKVKDKELGKPAKTVKARKKPTTTEFKELTSYGVSTKEQSVKDIAEEKSSDDKEPDGMERLYGIWQTDAWSPKPVAPDEDIPVNEYKNIELALLNPGLVHLDQRGMSKVAKRLGIPYAPCLLGFEGHGGNRTPTIRGIVVHMHNADLLREAFTEWESQNIEQEHNKRQREIHKRWKRLVVGLLTKERLEREYGEDN